jgi:hypothetical protein
VAEVTRGVFVYLQPCDKTLRSTKYLKPTKYYGNPDEMPIIIYTWDDYVGTSCEDGTDGTSGEVDADHGAITDETRSLDGVLTTLIEVQAMHVGVSYEDV